MAKAVVNHVHRINPDIRIIGAALPTALGSKVGTHGTPEQDAKRKALNDFIRNSGVFDGVLDFDAVTLNPANGQMKAEFVLGSTIGGPGDNLHPNRAGYLRMAESVDFSVVLP
ncbi:hypothetical protein AGMMS50256_24880 [Betaproteobacteria bacterium]|nr:hypothetical protein AGMMS50256_24880 [Betaproteobacteria bacterium]